jgi:hypothetical protein
VGLTADRARALRAPAFLAFLRLQEAAPPTPRHCSIAISLLMIHRENPRKISFGKKILESVKVSCRLTMQLQVALCNLIVLFLG